MEFRESAWHAHLQRPHLVIPCPRDPAGANGPTLDETRGPHWRSTSWGLYVPTRVELSTEQRIVEGAARLPAYGGVTGWAALHWQHAERWFDGTNPDGSLRPVTLAVGGDDIRPQPGIHICAERLEPGDLMVVDGVRLTIPARSVCFEMRYASSVREAARNLSMAAYYDLVSIDELAAYAAQHPGWIGIPQCRAGIPFAEENCWSPAEFDMVLVWRIDAELPRPLCNQPMFDLDGGHIGTPDLLDVEAGVIGQYHGGLHLSGAQRSIDERAADLYRDFGLECFAMFAEDRGHPGRMAERMHAARRRARWEPESQRRWTIEQPPWWTATQTVELRRGLSAEQQDRWLRYRVA